MKAREKILSMLEAGKITAEEAARLFEAINSATSQGDFGIEFDPQMIHQFRSTERRMRDMHCNVRPPRPPRHHRRPHKFWVKINGDHWNDGNGEVTFECED